LYQDSIFKNINLRCIMVYSFMRLSIFIAPLLSICVPYEVLYQDPLFQECHFKVYYGLFLHEIEYLFRSAFICIPSGVLYQDSIFRNVILRCVMVYPSMRLSISFAPHTIQGFEQ